jgi:hypothetical protein
MRCKRQFALILLAPLLLPVVACEKKAAAQKPNRPGPAEAPTLTETLPYEIQPQQVPVPPQHSAQAQDSEPKQPSKKRRSSAKKSATPPPPPGSSSPAAAPGPSDTATTAELHPPRPIESATVAIGPDVSSPEASRDRQSTTQLLDTTEGEVKKLEGQSLSSEQQSVLTQIKAYISQSRKAITDGDYERASNLAKKAQLLAQELTKR